MRLKRTLQIIRLYHYLTKDLSNSDIKQRIAVLFDITQHYQDKIKKLYQETEHLSPIALSITLHYKRKFDIAFAKVTIETLYTSCNILEENGTNYYDYKEMRQNLANTIKLNQPLIDLMTKKQRDYIYSLLKEVDEKVTSFPLKNTPPE